ncbi:MAG TPA: nucleotidyltransferase family protein [Gaiellaceae bacterium]|nr:nucleotidyltransferase family protein [Gaiellaceae bacterium]
MEALILAGGKAERLGDAAQGKPKALVDVAGCPLAVYQVRQLVAAGVDRVIVSCAAGMEEEFVAALDGLGAEIVPVPEAEPLGRGGGLRLAATARRESGPVYALNGDELVDIDLRRMVARHVERGGAATIALAPLLSPFGIVELDDDDTITGFTEAPRLPHWVSVGVYVLDDEALARLPERGDHEQTTFPELAGERKLLGWRHEGTWLTVNTPKQLRLAAEFVASHPEFLAA